MGYMIILVHCTFTLHPLHSILARRASEFTTEWSQVRLPVKHRTIIGKLFTPLVSLSPCSIFYVPRKKEKITVGNGRGVVYCPSYWVLAHCRLKPHETEMSAAPTSCRAVKEQ